MTNSNKHGKKEPNLWREAYKALYADGAEKEHMQKVQAKLRKRLNQPDLDLKTDKGYKVMLSFISKQASGEIQQGVAKYGDDERTVRGGRSSRWSLCGYPRCRLVHGFLSMIDYAYF